MLMLQAAHLQLFCTNPAQRRSMAMAPSANLKCSTCPQGPIHRIALALSDREAITACSDGSCILWDLLTFKRRCILAAGSSIADACYSTDQSQLITAGKPCKPSCSVCKQVVLVLALNCSRR